MDNEDKKLILEFCGIKYHLTPTSLIPYQSTIMSGMGTIMLWFTERGRSLCERLVM